jgi:serine/threonine protein kinase
VPSDVDVYSVIRKKLKIPDIPNSLIEKLVFPHRNNLSAFLNSHKILEMSYLALIQEIKSRTRVELADQLNIHVNGELGGPCASWQVAFVDKSPYILKPLSASEYQRVEALKGIRFPSQHVVEFLVYDVSDIRGQAIVGSPPIKKMSESVVNARMCNIVMLMPILPITLDHMPWRAFKNHVISFITQITDGLASMHGLSFAHMDVKPSNIAITYDGSFVLIDLGSAARFGQFTQTTDAFLPKSLWRNRYVSRPEHDYWMLAMTLVDKLHEDPIVGRGAKDFDMDEVLQILDEKLAE